MASRYKHGAQSFQVRSAELKRYFENLEVVEASAPLHLQPQHCDIETAQRDDPTNCAFSRACQRMYGSRVVLFFGTVAYVDLLDENGEKKIHRFVIDRKAQEFIKAFDAGEDVRPGGFRLSPPPPSSTLDGCATRSKKLKARIRSALLKGEAYEPDPKFRNEGMKHPNATRIRNFRTGTGMVHFPKARDAVSA